MLVLRRRAGEAILVGTDIEIEVIEISRTRVKLGVRAPRTVSVARREVAALATQNRSASELFAFRGREGMDKLARSLQTFSGETAQTRTPAADM
jgi:carbon storage regulator